MEVLDELLLHEWLNAILLLLLDWPVSSDDSSLSRVMTMCYFVFNILGAYGAAVLYRKKDDDSLVILKEINMLDLSASERQMALNEVYIFDTFLNGI